MAQPILKRRLNPLLLISTVAALSLLAGVAVISQDRIATAQKNVTETTAQLKDARELIDELQVEKENKSRKINGLRSNLTETYNALQQSEEEIENKTEEVQSLQTRLDQQEEALDQSETVEGLNESLNFICAVYEGGQNAIEEECTKWNHEVGTASAS